MGQLIWRNSTT